MDWMIVGYMCGWQTSRQCLQKKTTVKNIIYLENIYPRYTIQKYTNSL
uniref:Uncharacterized protein n=1 Tax=Anguilla anguilla TaxID=7936 RepID=A0A0E9RRT4_ANGAN